MFAANIQIGLRRNDKIFLADCGIRNAVKLTSKTNVGVHIDILFDDNKRKLSGALDYVDT